MPASRARRRRETGARLHASRAQEFRYTNDDRVLRTCARLPRPQDAPLGHQQVRERSVQDRNRNEKRRRGHGNRSLVRGGAPKSAPHALYRRRRLCSATERKSERRELYGRNPRTDDPPHFRDSERAPGRRFARKNRETFEHRLVVPGENEEHRSARKAHSRKPARREADARGKAKRVFRPPARDP